MRIAECGLKAQRSFLESAIRNPQLKDA